MLRSDCIEVIVEAVDDLNVTDALDIYEYVRNIEGKTNSDFDPKSRIIRCIRLANMVKEGTAVLDTDTMKFVTRRNVKIEPEPISGNVIIHLSNIAKSDNIYIDKDTGLVCVEFLDPITIDDLKRVR